MAQHRVIVYGGKGALGSVCVAHLKSKSMWVGSVDVHPNEEADANVLIKIGEGVTWQSQTEQVVQGIEATLNGEKLDAILCVAGGWAGGNASSEELVKNANLMCSQSVWSSVIAAHAASKFLKPGGFLQLTGAEPALRGTCGMIGYGMAKAAVHQLVRGLGQKGAGLPAEACALAILPVTLDTPMNRKFMADADFSKWTPLTTVASQFEKWIVDQSARPKSGSLLTVKTAEGHTEFGEVAE